MFRKIDVLREEVKPDTPAEGGENVWDEMADTTDFVDPVALEPDLPPPSKAPKDASPDQPLSSDAEPPSVEPPPTAKEPESAPAPKAAEPAAVPEPKVAEPPPTVPATPVDYAALREQHRATLEKGYALSADQAAQLLTEPETVLPKLAAQVHQAVLEQALAQVYSILPQAVQQITEGRIRESEAEQEFFTSWPELRGHKQEVMAAGNMFRQINRTASKDVAIQTIGAMVMQALGMQRAAAAAPPPPPTQKPFQPAGTGASSAPRAPAPQPTVWDEMVQNNW